MYNYSRTSIDRLSTCHPKLQDLCYELIKLMDVTIVCGRRSKEAQDEAFNNGVSKVKWPNSKHNSTPSMAVDIAPYRKGGIDWGDRERFAYMAGLMKGIAASRGVKIRWGGDWDNDGEIKDHRFIDMPHFELVE